MAIELHVRQDVGKGDVIVLLHGIFADGTQWEKITDMLKSNYRVIVVDLLGHGRSPRPKNASYSPQEQVSALRNALERINATKNLTVVGYSMGGAVALSYCATYQQGVDQLVLISTPYYLKPEQMLSTNYAGSVVFTKLSTTIFKGVEALFDKNRVLSKIVPKVDKSKKFHKMIGANDNKLDATVIRLCMKNLISEFDFSGMLSKVTIPVSYYAGKKDLFVVQGQLSALKKIHPYLDVQRLSIIKIDHMLVQNLPKEMVALITKNSNKLLHVGADKGTGAPLILLHGIESSSSYWNNIIPALAENHRVIAIDLLGFGNSPKPLNIAYSLNDQVTWLKRTLDSLHINSADIAGHSLGSLVSLAYAAAYPKQVTSLTMFSPVLIPAVTKPKNYMHKSISYIHTISDTSFLYSRISAVIGESRLIKYMPSIRSIENSIKHQNSKQLATKAAAVPASFILGDKDQLIDKDYIKQFAKHFKQSIVTILPKMSHNFPIFSPNTTLTAIDKNIKHKHSPKATQKIPVNFAKQLIKLATPLLMINSLVFIALGLLLFTRYAPLVLVLCAAVYVIYKSIKLIQGAFSLKHEGLAYIGYILLGLFGIVVGYGLTNHQDLAVHITVFVICGLVLLAGLMRVLVALVWTKKKLLRRSLLLTGFVMSLTGLAAFMGSIASIYFIIYGIAVILIAKGLQYGLFGSVAFVMAYIRGFNNS